MSALVCPKCGADEWAAQEISTNYPLCSLTRIDDEVEIELDPMAELSRVSSDTFISAYLCQKCPYSIDASLISYLKEAPDEA